MVTTKKNVHIDDEIYQISTLVAGDFKLDDVLGKLSAKAVEITGTDACSIRLLDEESDDLEMCSSYGLSDEYRNKGVVSKNDPVIEKAFFGEAIVIDDMRKEKIVKYRKEAIKEGLVSQLTVVMKFKTKAIGVLRLYRKKLAPFDVADIKVARLVASQCAIAITNARFYNEAIEGARMAQQVKFAGEIQRRMIPEVSPTIPGLDIAGAYQPCFEVGGDLYDYIKMDEKHLLVVIADVIGKGIPAAIMMSMFRGTIKAFSHGGHERHSLLEIVEELNRLACSECRDGEFVTMFIACINVEDMTLTYCNCGHEPAILFRNHQMTELSEGGMVLGVLPGTEYTTTELKLNKKDLVLFYTDGLTDAVDFEGSTWGTDKMLEVASEYTQYSAEAFIKHLLSHRRRFVGLARQIDDTSIVAIKVKNTKNALKPKSKAKLKSIEKALKKKKKTKEYKKSSKK